MSTAAAFGLHIDGVDKLSYCHADGNPSHLGASLILQTKQMLTEWSPDKLQELARAVRLVHMDAPVSDYDRERYLRFMDPDVDGGVSLSWYSLLRKLQGDLRATLLAGVMLDTCEFVLDSLDCEWAYILNLDDQCFELYKGRQTAVGKGRFAKRSQPDFLPYYPCSLVQCWPLQELPPADSLTDSF